MPRRRISSVALRAWGGFFLVIVLVGAAIFGLEGRLERAAAARTAVAESAEHIDQLNLLLRHVLDAEVGQRGFVIAGDPRFLRPYEASVATVDGTLATVEANLEAHGGRHRSALRDLIAAKFGFMNRMIELRRTQGFDAAAAEVSKREGIRLMDAIRVEIGRLVEGERSQLGRLNAVLQAEERDARRATYLTLCGALGLVLAIGLMLLRQIRDRNHAQRRARQGATLMRVTLDHIGAGVAIVGPDGRIVDQNAELLRLFPEAEGNDSPAALADERALAAAGRPFLFERTLDDTSLVVRGVPLPSARFLVTWLDVSGARRAERVKSEFVSTVSHELRTPVTSIRGALGMLAGPLAAGMADKQRSLVDIALRNADRLTLLVNDILDIEKIESGRMVFDFQACDLNQLLFDAAETNRAYAEARDVTLALGTLPRPLLVRADPNRIQQVMSNLISNAVKFSDPGALVTIAAEQVGDMARVSVNDRGPGVPEEFKARIFQRFAQADGSDTRAKGGTGLGLSIARAIVQKHDGDLRFDSVPGDTTFTFTMPLCGAVQEAA